MSEVLPLYKATDKVGGSLHTCPRTLHRGKTGATPWRKNRGDSLFSLLENRELYRLFRAQDAS